MVVTTEKPVARKLAAGKAAAATVSAKWPSMERGPKAGHTARTTVPGTATVCAARPMASVMAAEVLGLMTSSFMSGLRGRFLFCMQNAPHRGGRAPGRGGVHRGGEGGPARGRARWWCREPEQVLRRGGACARAFSLKEGPATAVRPGAQRGAWAGA